jgi:intracellular multiplication protein IcmV
MAAKTKIVNFFKKRLNFFSWSDAPRLKDYSKYIWSVVKKFFSVRDPKQSRDDFEAVVVRLAITPEELQKKYKALLHSSIAMLVVSIIIFAYFIHTIMSKHFSAAWLSFIVFLISLSLTFRYNFLSFQIKQRRLGCNLQEWLNAIIGQKK